MSSKAKSPQEQRLSLQASLTGAAIAFPFSLALAVLFWGVVFGWALGPIAREAYDRVYLGIYVALVVVSACVISRIVYMALRWRNIEDDGQYCRKCGYDLTGNTSGICSECGKPISYPTSIISNLRMLTRAQLRSALFDAAIAFLKGDTKSFEFDEQQLEIQKYLKKDRSAGHVANVFWLFYDDYTDHPISTTEEGWNLFRRYAAFLKTDLELESHVFRHKHRGQKYALCSLLALLAGLVASIATGSWLILLLIWIAAGIVCQSSAWPGCGEGSPDSKRLQRYAPFWSEEEWEKYAPLLEPAGLPTYDPEKHSRPWKRTLGLRLGIFWPSYVIKVVLCPLGLLWSLFPIRQEVFMVKQEG